MPKPEWAPPEGPVAVDDRPVMVAGIAGFGLSIPWLTGLYGPLTPADGLWWGGQAAFLALAAALWWCNRWLLFEQRKHFDWFAHPWRKLSMMVTANVLFTAPLTAAAIGGWLTVSDQPGSMAVVPVVVLTNVICVLFVTHAYETVFLIREREGDLLRVERLERLRSQAELAALKAQLDPHFLFNSLNTLGHLIVSDATRGREFCDRLAEVYRYVLATRDRDLVPLADELDFVRAYHRLLVLRFGAGIQLETDPALETSTAWTPPLAVQTLLENAVKHNRTGEEQPLTVRIGLEAGALRVSNPLQPRSSQRRSQGLGLRNLDERCRLLCGQPLAVAQEGGRFEVRVPLREPLTSPSSAPPIGRANDMPNELHN